MDAIAVSLSIFIEIYYPKSKKNQFCNVSNDQNIIFVGESWRNSLYRIY